MAHYYVNNHAQRNGDQEVHEATCSFLPEPENRTYLGTHLNCKEAVKKAREYYSRVNGCYYCAKDCQTS